MGLGHTVKGVVTRTGVAVLAIQFMMTGSGKIRPVVAGQELGGIGAGDDDFFPRFQRGYFAASAAAFGNVGDQTAGGRGKGGLECILTRVAAKTGPGIAYRAVGCVIFTSPQHYKRQQGKDG